MLKRLRNRLAGALLAGNRYLLHLRGRLASFYNRAPHRISANDNSRRAHAGLIADLFASIMCRIDGIGMEDMDTAMDILRYDFPNVEHIWLAERLQNAYRARYPLEATLKLAAANRTVAERYSLALEILTMLHRVGGDLTNPGLFEEVTRGLQLPLAHKTLPAFFATPGARMTDAPIETLSFSEDIAQGNVTLSSLNRHVRFRVVRCVNLLIIINDAKPPLSVREHTLHEGDVIPLSAGQSITLADSTLTYATIRGLLLAQYAGVRYVCYLALAGDSVSVIRQRQLNSVARVSFGVHVEIEILRKDAAFLLDGVPLQQGETVCTTYFTPFSIKGLGPYTFKDLHDTGDPGHSYQLDPRSRKVTVSNLPYMNRPGVLMLAPGLAPGIVFEVSYSSESHKGKLRVLEGDAASLTVRGVAVRGGEFELTDGDLIELSAVQFLRCRFSAGVLDEESSLITSLSVRGLTRDFVRSGRVVDNISFTLQRGEMACILGPSGSGKSTLLSLLAGHLTPSFGSVFYNEELLTPENINLRQHIAFIPREDILDEAMTVGEHVYQASITRRPRLNHTDRMRRVNAVLNFVGLSQLARRNVGRAGERTISDGERSRLNLGLDLTGTAEVFLIDEPISGLSSADAERVIDTLEGMSSGRILLCTLHRPAQTILNRFHKVMVLNAQGQIAFWGTPGEMVRYFQEAVREMGLHVSREAVAAGGADYVFEVLSAPYGRFVNRRPSPSMWQERFEGYLYRRSSLHGKEPTPEPPGLPNGKRDIPISPARSCMELWRLFALWFVRTLLGRSRSRMGLYALLLEGPVLALLIAGTLRAASDSPYTFYKALHINEYLFLSLVLAMFFGLTDAACEILRDRLLLRRESNYKPFIPGYLLAKCLVLTGIAALQCALYLLVGNAILSIHEMFWGLWGILCLTAFVGIALSLMVSAIVRSERSALNIVPLLLVPQILLAGALVRFEEMNEFSPKIVESLLPDNVDERLSSLRHRVAYQDETTHNISSKPVPLIAEFCPLRYAFEMMFVLQASDNLWEVENNIINDKRDELKKHGSDDEVRFIQRAALLLNTTARDKDEARRILRRVRKIALSQDEDQLRRFSEELDARPASETDQPLEFYFSNRRLVAIREGVKTARKDARHNERHGFFLSPRQAAPLGWIDQGTDAGSVSTIWRNGLYLFFMGLLPILFAGFRLKRICRGK